MTALQDLLAVQDLDVALDQMRHRRDHLPEREERAGMDRAEGELAGELAGVEDQVADLARRQSAAEAELAATEDRSAQVDKRLYSGEVTAARDLQAMTAELDHLKGRSSSLEDTVLEILEEREPLDARIEQLRSARADLARRREELSAQLTGLEAAIDAEVAAIERRRADTAGAVPAPLLSTYERLRARLGGVGVARLSGSRCDGCHLTLSAAELEHVRHLPDGEVYTCEQCSRILVP